MDADAQSRARERLTYFDRLLEITDDAIVGTDAEFRVTVWNPGAERLYGYTAEEVMGRPAREVASYEGDQSRTRLEGDLLEVGRSRTELTAVRPDGTPVEVDISVVAIREGAGPIAGYLGIHRDISERKRAEREQERLAAVVRHSSDFVGMADMEGIPFFVNDAGRRLVGLGDADVGRTHVIDYFAPADRDFVGDVVLPLIRDEGRWPALTDLRMRHWVTEATIPVLFHAFRIDDPVSGEPIAMATVTRDNSEREQAEREREERSRQQAAIAELGLRALARTEDPGSLMNDAVALVARTLEVRHASVGAVDEDEIVLVAGTGWPAEAVGRTRAPAGRGTFAGYTLFVAEPVVSDDVTADPRFDTLPVLDQATPTSAAGVVIPGPDEPFGALTAFRESPRAFSSDEVEFLQSVANVLAVAIDRTRAERALEEVREAERRRIARALHDEALQELAAASARSDGNPGLTEVRPMLKGVVRQLRGAIFDLRLGDERDRPLPELVGRLAEVHRELDGFAIEIDLGDGVPETTLGTEGIEIVRILGEALTNVRKHAHASYARVGVWASGATLCAEVVDDGTGFDCSRETRGAGIRGMRERAELIGADLDVRSAPGAGTTVRLEVLLEHDGDGSQPETRVLLIEDHAAVREALAAALEREPGLRVVGQASTLAEARAMLHDVDLAVLDLALPDGFGPDLIAELRAVNRDAQALVLSASLDPAEAARAVGRGAAAIMHKTSTLQELVASVKSLRAGETLLPVAEVAELVRLAAAEDRREHFDRLAIESLTRRELEVLQLLAEGLDSAQIAHRLHISPRTQRNHIANIFRKLEVHSQLQALVFALRYGIVKVPGAR